MEVFLSGLPTEQLTARSLEQQLTPLILKLGIGKHDFGCEKAARSKFANLTFRHPEQARLFLRHYGEVPESSTNKISSLPQGQAQPSPFGRDRAPRSTARLRLLGKPIWCRKSIRAVNPITLRGMDESHRRHQEKESKALTGHRDQDKHQHGVDFDVMGVACGHYAFVSQQLAYFPEREWPWMCKASFTKLNLHVRRSDGTIRMRIPLSTIHEIVWYTHDDRQGTLTLTLDSVPWFLTEECTLDDLMARIAIGSGKIKENQQNRMQALDEQHAEIVGTCLTYHFNISSHSISRDIKMLERKSFTNITRYKLAIWNTPHPTLGSFKDKALQLRQELKAATSASINSGKSLPHSHLFVLQALFYNGYLHPATVLEILHQLFRRFYEDRLSGRTFIAPEAVKSLMDAECIPWPSPYEDPEYFEVSSLMKWIYEKNEEFQGGFDLRTGQLRQNSNLTHIYRVVVTPTRITLHGPEIENKNRVLRKYPKHQDCFVRVQFCDENTQDIRFSPKISYDRVYSRFLDVLNRGIQIAGRVYNFLGFSHSSLRTHSAWFSAPFFDQGSQHTHASIIKSLGEFSSIQCPAKCAARIGQAFSETPSVVDLRDHDVEVVTHFPDITNRDGSRVFSDGVGKISESMMHIIWENIPMKKNAPTCFQVRWGGAKGMLALDMTLKGTKVCFRDSMTKFESDDVHQLEICDSGSKPIPLVLNRQMIKILEDMGTDRSWFMRLQSYRLQELRSITASAYNTWHFLDAQNVGQAIKLGKFINFADKHGMDYRTDDFMRSVVEAVVLRELRLLKHKARIPVKYGKTLFGIIDETGYLREGEVVISFGFSQTGEDQPTPPQDGQIVIVTRSPALHPGDIQIAKQVVPPPSHPLSHHINCIIFSQHGQRDLPSQLSGGDLDGDIYNVIWDGDAMPKETFDPADYPRVEAQDIGRRVVSADMAQFFIGFMKTDHLGVIATRHVILADQLDDGTLSQECRTLAGLHSTAVDFSKSGIPAELKALPRANKFRPDFLSPGPITNYHDKGKITLEEYTISEEAEEEEEEGDGPRYGYYRSEKVLGQLYREIDEEKIWNENIRVAVDHNKPSFWETFIDWAIKSAATVGAVSWPVRIDSARRLKSAYDDHVRGHMSKYSDHPVNPISEREVFIGAILNKTGVQTHRQRDASHKLRDEFERTANHFARQMRMGNEGPDCVPLTGYMAELGPSAALDLCLACVCVASEQDVPLVASRLGISKSPSRRAAGRNGRKDGENSELQSFRLVAATQFLRELRVKERELGVGEAGGKGGGGFVGVSAYA